MQLYTRDFVARLASCQQILASYQSGLSANKVILWAIWGSTCFRVLLTNLIN